MRIYCPKCKQKRVQARYGQNRWVKWIDLKCGNCGLFKRMKEDEIDCIQPSSPLWGMVYTDDIFEETERKKKEMAWAEEKRKEHLDAKYDKEFTKPWERKFVKEKVLEEK